MLNLPDILTEKMLLSDLLESLQPLKVPDCTFSGMNMIPTSGSIDYLYIGAYSFLAEALDVGMLFIFSSLLPFVFSVRLPVTNCTPILLFSDYQLLIALPSYFLQLVHSRLCWLQKYYLL